jgi:sugar O-acyltransferase (sialic acid O-acetyltransferase NeuD family)
MARKLVIFGAGDIAQLAHFYLAGDGGREVAAFTVDAAYLQGDTFDGLPLTPFEQVQEAYPPAEHDLFVAMSYTKLNAARAQKCAEGKAKGYRLASYVSTRATTFAGFTPGENCFILEDNTIQPFVRIGANVTLWSGNHVGHHSEIADNCFIASHVVISGGVKIGESCFIGVNATLRDHVTIGARCVIGAGALVLADTEPEGVYVGAATERSKVPSTRLRRI